MFGNLYNIIFPSLGDAFGLLSALAGMPFQDFLTIIGASSGFSYTNLFTGVIAFCDVPNLSLFGSFFSIFGQILTPTAFYDLPTWVVLVYHSFSLFLFIALAKYLLSSIL